MATVIHIKDAPPGWREDPMYVYVGRPRKGMSGIFGNPFPKNENRTREEAIGAFRRYAAERVALDPAFAKAVSGLKGKVLVCFCAPKPCHGHVLAEMSESVSCPPDEKDDFFDVLGL